MKRFAKHAIFYGVLFAIWAVLRKLKIWPPYASDAERCGGVVVGRFRDHSFWIAIVVSMKRMLLGYSLSVVLGMARAGRLREQQVSRKETDGGLLVSLQSLPSILPVSSAVLWFGLTEKAIIFVVVMDPCFP